MKTTVISLVIACTIAGTLRAAAATETGSSGWRLEGFDQPESVLYDKERNQLIVSNISGAPGEANGEGYLSRISPDGRVLALEWIDGFNAPKGMGIYEDRLFVADLQRFHIVDLTSNAIERTIEVPQSGFLNDVSVDEQGRVYVSDFMDHAIYRYTDGALSLWYRDERLSHPNGVLVHEGWLYVGSWGRGLQKDFTTAEPGSLMAIEIETKTLKIVPNGESIGNIDGVIALESSFLLSDWVTGQLHRVAPGQGHDVVATLKSGIADISASGRWLYLPFMMDGAIEARPISTLSTESADDS